MLTWFTSIFILTNPDELNKQIQNTHKKHTYTTVRGIPPADVVQRIKKLMEPLRAEFGGPEIEPHITVVGSVLKKHDDAVQNFIEHMPHMSLLYGNLTEEERKRALEKVTELDDTHDSIASLKLTMTHVVLYKTHNEARDQHSWDKVMEYNLRHRH